MRKAVYKNESSDEFSLVCLMCPCCLSVSTLMVHMAKSPCFVLMSCGIFNFYTCHVHRTAMKRGCKILKIHASALEHARICLKVMRLNTKVTMSSFCTQNAKALLLRCDREVCHVLNLKVLEVIESKGNYCSLTDG